MKFVLFRHGSKGFTPFEDPELNAQGFQQSIKLAELVKSNGLPSPTRLFVSPRRRTSQTFYPVSKELSLEMQIKEELDLRQPEESQSEFRSRIQGFLDFIARQSNLPAQQNNEVIFACTHYDWIEESLTLIDCDKNLNSFEFSHWGPSQFLIFEIDNSGWKVLKKGDAK
ncbi:MAG: phosphoglycerate mutase [Pseudobdellovibrio sp.]|jgi:phosphohistidine phosphatase SixA|nr:phosphoglycerate mutase [Pseudobdellovibrio sp.]